MIRSAYPSPLYQDMLSYEISLLDMMVRFGCKSSNTKSYTFVVKSCMPVVHRELGLNIPDCGAAVKTINCLDSVNIRLGGRPYHM